MLDPWKFLDELNIEVFCISLRNRNDRYKSSREEFEKVGLLSRVKYYFPEKNPHGGREGCWESHKCCILNSKGTSLIFEDDISFDEDWYTQLYTIEQFLKSDIRWNIFYLGGMVYQLIEKYDEPKVSLVKCITLHGYFIHKDCNKQLQLSDDFDPYLYESLHLDTYYYKKFGYTFILNEPICRQKNNLPSDNDWNDKTSYKFVKFCCSLYKYYAQKYFWTLLFKINNYLYIRMKLPNLLNPCYYLT